MAATLFASECRLCRHTLDSGTALPVCSLCVAASRLQHQGPLCATCAEALPPDAGASFAARLADAAAAQCAECTERPRAFAGAAAHGDYAGRLREVIHLLKFHAVRSTAAPLGAWTAAAAHRRLAVRDVVVVAVPMSAARRRTRAFNHAEVLAGAVSQELRSRGWKTQEEHGVLRRVKSTASQFELNPRQRRANLRGAFVCDPTPAAIVQGRDVLLVDDILTTGTTANHCAAALKKAGAANVWVATAARSQPAFAVAWDGGVDDMPWLVASPESDRISAADTTPAQPALIPMTTAGGMS